jgi:taurine--2-oxoglutarate transaminase
MEQGVSMVGWISHLVLAPPLILTEGQLDECIAALDEALKITDALVV